MKALHLALILLALVSLNGCATSGNGKMKVLTHSSAEELLTPGKTTREEVKQQLGEGMSLRFDSGYEAWVYEFAHGIPRFVDYMPFVGHVTRRVRRQGKEVRILFNPDGVVQKYLVLDIAVDPDNPDAPPQPTN